MIRIGIIGNKLMEATTLIYADPSILIINLENSISVTEVPELNSFTPFLIELYPEEVVSLFIEKEIDIINYTHIHPHYGKIMDYVLRKALIHICVLSNVF